MKKKYNIKAPTNLKDIDWLYKDIRDAHSLDADMRDAYLAHIALYGLDLKKLRLVKKTKW